jgi:restriction system protein
MPKKTKIDASNLPLNQWLKLLFRDPDSVSPNNYFPNETAKDEYLKKIKGTSENKVKDLLRIMLPKTGYSQLDIIKYSALKSSKQSKFKKLLKASEYFRKISTGRSDIWEGLCWILDLLPHNPKEAIQTLEAYFTATMHHMSDSLIWSNGDCIDIITAKYYDLEHPRSILLDIDPIEFEWLIEELYKEIGYTTEWTGKANDQGIDIIASKNDIGKKEKTIIQCKRYNGTISSPFVRDLFGIVTSKKATKGVLVSTSEFSRECVKFASENPSIELIGYKSLNRLLNKHLGSKWPLRMKFIYRNKRKEIKATQNNTP